MNLRKPLLASLLCAAIAAEPASATETYGSSSAVVNGVDQIAPDIAASYPLPASTSNNSVALTASLSFYPFLTIYNLGTVPAYLANGATATTSGIYLPAGSSKCISVAGASSLAAITATGSTTLEVDQANACVPIGGGGGSGGSASLTGNYRWVAGSGYGANWTAVFGTEINSLANTDAIQSSVVVANGTALDTYMSISAAFGSITTASGAPYVGFYLYPLNQDGTTYGDGRFASAAVGPPLPPYYLCSIALVPSVTQAQEGSCGSLQPIPPGNFIVVAYNLSGAPLASSGNTVKAQTDNLTFH